jgi:hypothetical protein
MKPRRLFHTIVILGASLTSGCGGDGEGPVADTGPVDAGADSSMMADASGAMDATAELDAMLPGDGGEEDGMVLIL